MIAILQENKKEEFCPKKEWVSRIERDWIIDVSNLNSNFLMKFITFSIKVTRKVCPDQFEQHR